jgi:hypothetical protein
MDSFVVAYQPSHASHMDAVEPPKRQCFVGASMFIFGHLNFGLWNVWQAAPRYRPPAVLPKRAVVAESDHSRPGVIPL